jgi:hypothetical protein
MIVTNNLFQRVPVIAAVGEAVIFHKTQFQPVKDGCGGT